MANAPDFLTEETEEIIKDRMLGKMPEEYDKTEGSMPYDSIAPAASEFAQAKDECREMLRRGFISTVAGTNPGEKSPYVDLRLDERGLSRKPAVAASGYQLYTGVPGTLIPLNSRLSTASTKKQPAITFKTTSEGIIGAAGTILIPIIAETAGASGNVAADKIIFMVEDIDGVTSVTNPNPTTGGVDEEDDISALQRYYSKVRSNSAGGNKADYTNWALEVTGVGGASVVPVRDGPGTVSIAIIDANKLPASDALIDAVQDYIAPPWRNQEDADSFTLGGSGVSLEAGAIKMDYDVGGAGSATKQINAYLQQPGIWMLRPSTKVDSIAAEDDLLQIGVWNLSLNDWCKTTPIGNVDAVITVSASDLLTDYAESISQDFYWNGVHNIEIRATRLQTDTTTILWIEHVSLRSAFSKDTGEGKAPCGHRVTVEAAGQVTVNVSVHLILKDGSDEADAKSAAEAAIQEYIKSIAFQKENDVAYNKSGNAILNAEGVEDFSDLLLNGATANIQIGDQDVAVLGVVTFT
jgi:uncharacterized phage protein gp47/JayE